VILSKKIYKIKIENVEKIVLIKDLNIVLTELKFSQNQLIKILGFVVQKVFQHPEVECRDVLLG
jgi:hypothetical protein